MKKILIGILTILVIVLIVLVLTKGIAIGNFKIASINNIKSKSSELDSTLNNANELTKKTYLSKLGEIESRIKALSIAKENYENKTKYMSEDATLGVVEVKTYKVEFLWVIIENYAKKEGLVLKMDIETPDSSLLNDSQKVYNLDFAITGSYIGITDFIYDIENDEDLQFEIKNLVIESVKSSATNTNATTNTTTKKDVSDNGKNLQATFKIENIGIEL